MDSTNVFSGVTERLNQRMTFYLIVIGSAALLYAITWYGGLWPFRVNSIGNALDYAMSPLDKLDFNSDKCGMKLGIRDNSGVEIEVFNRQTSKSTKANVAGVGKGVRQYQLSLERDAERMMKDLGCRN